MLQTFIFLSIPLTLKEQALTTFPNQLLNFLYFCVLYKKKIKIFESKAHCQFIEG
jgi:hypothetical protein